MDNYETQLQDYIPIHFPLDADQDIQYYVCANKKTIVSAPKDINLLGAHEVIVYSSGQRWVVRAPKITTITPKDYSREDWWKLLMTCGVKITEDGYIGLRKAGVDFQALYYDLIVDRVITLRANSQSCAPGPLDASYSDPETCANPHKIVPYALYPIAPWPCATIHH